MANDIDWESALAAIAGKSGIQFREAIISRTGSSRSPVEWREALVENLGNGFAAVDWREALENKYSGMTWQAAIVQAMTDA